MELDVKKRLSRIFLTVLLGLSPGFAAAEDIDLFVGVPPPSSAGLPNLMVVIDNAANFSKSADGSEGTCTIDGALNSLKGTVGGVEQCALHAAITGLDTSSGAKINIGFMVYNARNIRDINNANCGGSEGGCLVQPLSPLTAANKTAILAWIKSWKTSGGAGSGYVKAEKESIGASLQETWAYYAGRTGISGRSYAALAPASACKNYVLFIGNAYDTNGTPGDSTGDKGPKGALEGSNTTALMNASPAATASQKALITTTLSTTCGSYTFPTSSHENKGFYADEWTRYMRAHNVSTYAIGVLGSGCKPEYAALLTSMASNGGGKYYPTTNYSGLADALENVFTEIQAVNSVFASVSLPVSVNTQGTYLNQVFIGMFRPDANALPRWFGNIKQYKVGFDGNGDTQLLDQDDRVATSNVTGFVSECARSYWTSDTANTYWNYKPQGSCTSNSAVANPSGYALDTSDTPDGNVVEKGAQATRLRAMGPSARTVYTCSSTFSSCSTAPSRLAFNAANTGLSAALVNWTIGRDVQDEHTNDGVLPSSGSSTVMRPSVHGDVLNSRPVAINHGTLASPSVVVYYGGNDGMLRAINGNRTGALTSGETTYAAGDELWSFVAPESFGNLQKLYDNNVQVSYLGSTASPQAPKPYGFDGPVAHYKDDDSTWIFASMRRGGRVLYAFDVTTPGNPSIKWKRGCPNLTNDTDCTNDGENGDFRNIGQTWSTPKAFKTAGYGSGSSPLLIMGGGYDACEDGDPNTCTSTFKGNRIYVLDAGTGVLKRAFTTERSVVGEVTLVRGATGLVTYAYAADLGGNLYRITFGTGNESTWSMDRIAALGCDPTSSPVSVPNCLANRKFMFAPDVVVEDGIHYILVGSGDREKPLPGYDNAYGVTNYFFMVKDIPGVSNWLTSENANCGANLICLNSLYAITNDATPTQSALDAKKGWYLSLYKGHEQVVTASTTVYGVTTFTSHVPATYVAGTCSPNLGDACQYNIRYLNAQSAAGDGYFRCARVIGGGLAPSPVAARVVLDTGEIATVIFGGGDTGSLQATAVASSPFDLPASTNNIDPTNQNDPTFGTATQPRRRVYWYLER